MGSPTKTYFVPEHYSSSFIRLAEFRHSDELCDINIKVGHYVTRCHRLVLAAAFPYFRAMFKSCFTESRKHTVVLHDVDEEAVRTLVEYAYTARFPLTSENVEELLRAADMIQADRVRAKCCEFLQENVDVNNCVRLLDVADVFCVSHLKSVCYSVIVDNYEYVSQSDQLLSLPLHSLKRIVEGITALAFGSCGYPCFKLITRWIKHDLTRRKHTLAELLGVMELERMSLGDLTWKVKIEELVRNDPCCVELVDEAEQKCQSLSPKLMCVAGDDRHIQPYASVRCYDPRRDKWIDLPEKPVEHNSTAACSVKTALYFTGGADELGDIGDCCYVYDALSASWKKRSRLLQRRQYHAMAELDGLIYAIGGEICTDFSYYFDSVECYSPLLDKWRNVASMNEKRARLSAVTLNGYIYALGGENDDYVYSECRLESCERYDPTNNVWSYIAPMNRERCDFGAVVFNGDIYVIGGETNGLKSVLSSVERYMACVGQWTEIPAMSLNVPRVYLSAAVVDGRLYTGGGEDGQRNLRPVEVWDEAERTWMPLHGAPALHTRSHLVALQTPDRLSQIEEKVHL